ncbi:Glycosyl hydrolases family 43 [Jatrophihabitans endophyticus]|uniref:Glycosyl hydrolases family 43 n=1 Tax=Jatrophihabitans endophyticus TaxID=1206085 RepID=A0A1M5RNK7_9ACTN|nr:family 43 glycosylhydrolase [Jatrophihabitans endophyticus]SHH27658.1 Glycosyl hydrolases family 43 [Jatrophihabitans endophyticus]
MRRPLTLVATGLVTAALCAAPALTATATAAPAKHIKAVTAGDFPDPGFAKFGTYYYIYKTGQGFGERTSVYPNRQYAPARTSMPKVPAWVGKASDGKRHLWAPHVFAMTYKGKALYVMYFNGYSPKKGANCLGIATSRSPSSNFKAQSKAVLCAKQKGYEAIDPSAYRAKDGKRYLIYKINYRNKSGFDIRAVQMDSATGTKRVAKVASRSLAAPKARIEAPSVISHGGRVWLFVSRKDYQDCSYSTEAWSAPTLWGGHFKPVRTVMNRANTGLCGPGGATVLQDGKTTRIAFHAYVDKNKNGVKDSNTRRAWVGVLKWNSKGQPYLY